MKCFTTIISRSLTIIFIFITTVLTGQGTEIQIGKKKFSENPPISQASAADELETDFNIDILFYHLDIDIDIDNEYIDGSVYIELNPTINNLDQVKLNLHSSLSITEVSENAESFSRSGRVVTINLDNEFDTNETVKLLIKYEGSPEIVDGTIKGFRFDSQSGAPAIVTLSTPYLSHYWFPCKDGPTDKADRILVDITIPNESYNGHPLIAVSNGLLVNETITPSGKKKFSWQHNHPIVPYYMMVAVSNYRIIERTYNKNGHNFPLTYYIFPNSYTTAENTIQNFYKAFDAFIEYYGDYPYKDEKYGMTQIVQDWAIENQPNAIVGNVSSGGYETMVHELSHMWFGASITNQTWNHVWLNEGFATYSEALYYEYNNGKSKYHSHLNSMNGRWSGQRLYMSDDSDPTKIFQPVYYQKGAWVLHMLRGYLGDDVFFNCIKTYAQNPDFKHKHATTNQFRDHCENISGVDLDNFFDQWIYDSSYPDYEYKYESFPEEGKVGLTIYQSQKEHYNERECFEMFVPLTLTFADGEKAEERVFNNKQTQTFYFDYGKELAGVSIDPEQWIIREIKYENDLLVPQPPKIKSFSIPGQIGESSINHQEGTILVTMPNGTNLALLIPTIIISGNASVSPASGSSRDFSAPVIYTVTTSTGTVKEYTVTVIQEINSENKILQFNIPSQIGESIINHEEHTVIVTTPFGTDRSALTPQIKISSNATIEPSLGTTSNFNSPVNYKVTAEDGSEANYTITVTNKLGTENLITSFEISGQTEPSQIKQEDRTISVIMPYNTDRSHLTPIIALSDSASVNPESGVERDFSNTVNYTVSAENTNTRVYSVTVTNEKNDENLIQLFTISGQIGETVINQETHTIDIIMPFGTNRSALIPIIEISEAASINPKSEVENDFSNPVKYTVTAENGVSCVYNVSVINIKNHENLITTFTIPGQVGESLIDQDERTILVTMPFGSDQSSLTPVIKVSQEASVNPESGVTKDFTNPISYIVTAENGDKATYSITVNIKLNDQNQIETFTIPEQSGSTQISHEAHTVFVKMPYGTILNDLTPVITCSGGATIDPATGISQDFSSSVDYSVTAQNGSTVKYAVTVSNEKNNENFITSFSIPGQISAIIDEPNHTIEVLLPFGSNRSSLTPIIEISQAAFITPASGISGNFTVPVEYIVTAENGDKRSYTVLVNNKPGTANQITSFTIPNQIGTTTISHTNNTIQVLMPYGTNRSSLTPNISVSDSASVSPASGIANNFTTLTQYSVTAENGDKRTYSVIVSNEMNSENLITAFTIESQIGESIIDQEHQTIEILMPFGTDRTSLIPNIEVSSGASVSPLSDEEHDFENPVEFTVAAENSLTRIYIVTVNNKLNDQNQIIEFSIPDQIGSSQINHINHTIEVIMPFGTDRSSLTPTIKISPAALVNPNSGISGNFTNQVNYTVTAENEVAQLYTVFVTNQLNNENEILKFSISGQVGSTIIDQNTQTIEIVMPYGISRSSLTPVIEISPSASVNPESETPLDFNNSVNYRVRAENGETRDYAVTVSNEKNDENLILEFAINNQIGSSIINHKAHSIEITMPFGTNRNALIPAITISEAASIEPLSGVAQDF